VTAGTIFHRTRTPLSTWFAAIWLVTSQKNGASAQNLHDMLGLGSYETAWAWLHKLRRAMVRPDRELLSGVVEVDESFIGGRATGRQGASTDKVPVMIAVENVGTQVNRKLRLGRVRLAVADAPGSKQLVEFARTTVAPGSLIRTDGARMFRVLAQEGYHHQYVSGYSSPEPGHVTLPGSHRVASLLKRWHPSLPRGTRAPAVLPRRVRLPVQSAQVTGPRAALLPAAAAERQHRSPPTGRPHRRHRA
jgi:transposase-like protein